MNKKTFYCFLIIGIVGFALLGFYFFSSSSRPQHTNKRAQEYRFSTLDVIAAHIVRLMKTDAKSVALLGEQASFYHYDYFANIGLEIATNLSQKADIIFTAEKDFDFNEIKKSIDNTTIVAQMFDVRDLSARKFKEQLENFPCKHVYLWMPGEQDWLLVGWNEEKTLSLALLLDAFSPDGATDDLVSAQCDSVAQLFASYVGEKDELLPAFVGDLDVLVRPEFFITQDIPKISWLKEDDLDDDIALHVTHEMRSLQIVRRLVVEGNTLATVGKSDEAMELWIKAALRNSHDSFLLDRLYRLAVNAVAFEKIGNLRGATKCYETMVTICPNDVATLNRYALCLRRLGERELADVISARANALLKKTPSQK